MPSLNLKHGKVLLYDDQDQSVIDSYKWYAIKPKRSETWYAVARVPSSHTPSGYTLISLHRTLLKLTSPRDYGDHRNGDGLDNRRQNLRVATKAQNHQNSSKRCDNRSGYKGVGWHTVNKVWRVRIRRKTIGLYKDVVEAAKAYDAAAVLLFGEFARTNFPQERTR